MEMLTVILLLLIAGMARAGPQPRYRRRPAAALPGRRGGRAGPRGRGGRREPCGGARPGPAIFAAGAD